MKALLGIVGGFVLTLAVFGSGLAFAAWILAAKPVRQATPTIGVSELWTKDAQPVDPQKQTLRRIPAAQASNPPAKAGSPTNTQNATQTTALASLSPATQQTEPSRPVQGAQLGQSASPQPAQSATVDQKAEPQLPADHLAWCATRYRSYRPAENTYRSYSGEVRPCISPYYDPGGDRTASTGASPNDRPANGQAGADDQQGAAADAGMSDDQPEMQGYVPSSDGYATYGGPPEEISPEAEQALGQSRQVSADHVEYCFTRYRSYDPRDNSYQPRDGGPRRHCE